MAECARRLGGSIVRGVCDRAAGLRGRRRHAGGAASAPPASRQRCGRDRPTTRGAGAGRLGRTGARRRGHLFLAAHGHQRRQCRAARLCVGLPPRHQSRPGVDAARDRRRHVRDQQFRPRVCARCGERQGALDLRPAASTVSGRATRAATPSIAGSSAFEGTLYVGALDGWLHAIDARTGSGSGRSTRWSDASPNKALHGHRRAAPRRRSRRHRQRRWGFRGRPRLCHRLRSRERSAALALLHRAAQSRGRSAGSAAPRGGREDLGSRASLGERAAAAPCGTAWRTTRRSNWCTSAPATRRPTTCTWTDATAATSSMRHRSSRSMPTMARSPGTTRRRPATAGTSTAREKIVLADLELGGKRRAVLMQASKNGFYYVLDRATGELLSAHNVRVRELDSRHRSEDRPARARCARRLRSGPGARVPVARRARTAGSPWPSTRRTASPSSR